MRKYYDYSIFRQFSEAFAPSGFSGFDNDHPVFSKTLQHLSVNRQFMYVVDILQMDYRFVSPGAEDIIGIEAENCHPGYLLSMTHPEDISRIYLAWSGLIRKGVELFFKKQGRVILSTTIKTIRPNGRLIHLLYQGSLFYPENDGDKVFLLMIVNDISDIRSRNQNFHHYMGEEEHIFRYPDAELLNTHTHFSGIEYEILRLIESGFTNIQIARKMNRRIETITAHRSQIRRKSGKLSLMEVIIDLKSKGLM